MASLHSLLSADAPVPLGWSSSADPGAGEILAQAGLPLVLLDFQHGLLPWDAMPQAVSGIVAGGAGPLVRIPEASPHLAGYAFDMGAEAVIAPMIETVEQAEALVSGGKYPPLGRRSWGPQRALALSGLDKDRYLAEANTRHLIFAMVETATTLQNLDGVAGVEGIDGLFVGPNDLCISLTEGARVDPADLSVEADLARILEACHTAGIFSGIYANTAAFAAQYKAMGFDMIACAQDVAAIKSGAEAALLAFRQATR